MPLRPDQVAAAIRSGSSQKIPDGHNLYLVTRRGRGFWVYQFRDGDVIRSKGLGSAATVTPAQARRDREDFAVRRRNGEIPRGRDTRAAGVRFAEAVRAYLDRHADEWSATQRKLVAGLFRLHAAPLDARPVGRITTEEVADILRPIWTGPGHGQGSRLRGVMERIFRAENVEPNPAQWLRLENFLSRKAVKVESHPSLPYAQLPAFMVELAAVPSIPALALRFLILTGVRSQEAIGARWEEIDLDAKVWTIPAARMKMKEVDTVPLGESAVGCLSSRGTGFVFPSSRSGGRITRSGLNKTLAKLKRVDVQGRAVTVHGFRSTMSTWAQDNGFAEPVIDAALAHKERSRTRRAYLRSDLLPERRKLADAWARYACAPAPSEA